MFDEDFIEEDSNNDDFIDENYCESLLIDFGVKSEEELFSKLVEESETFSCTNPDCIKQVEFSEVVYVGGDPYCSDCAFPGYIILDYE